jgi:hypothetical protein
MRPADNEPLALYDICEIACRNTITPWTLKAEIKRGNLKAFLLGRRYFTTLASFCRETLGLSGGIQVMPMD